MMMDWMSPTLALKAMRFWAPFLGAGISVSRVNKEFTEVIVQMKQRLYNTNYVGVHFGGSLYSMCDPFFMFILLHHLRSEHIVWDKGATIEFIKPGKGRLTATFQISLEEIEKIKKQALEKFKVEPEYYVEVKDKDGEVIARIKKILYVRRKDAKTRFQKLS